MAALRQGLRSRKPKSPDPLPITNAERCRLYKESIRKDPLAYEIWKEKKRVYNQQYKEKLKQQTPDQAALLREKNRLRQQQRRARLKAEKPLEKRAKSSPLPVRTAPNQTRIQTREQSLKEQEKREKARLRQQKRRAKMHPQKKRRENEKRMEYYYRKKASPGTPVVPATTSKQRKNPIVRLSSLLGNIHKSLKKARPKPNLEKLDFVKAYFPR